MKCNNANRGQITDYMRSLIVCFAFMKMYHSEIVGIMTKTYANVWHYITRYLGIWGLHDVLYFFFHIVYFDI